MKVLNGKQAPGTGNGADGMIEMTTGAAPKAFNSHNVAGTSTKMLIDPTVSASAHKNVQQPYPQDPIEQAFDSFFLFMDDVREGANTPREEGGCGCGDRTAENIAHNEIMEDWRDDAPPSHPCPDIEMIGSLDKFSHGFCDSAKGTADSHREFANVGEDLSLNEEPPMPAVVLSISGEPPSLRIQHKQTERTAGQTQRKAFNSAPNHEKHDLPEFTTAEMLVSRIKSLLGESMLSTFLIEKLGSDGRCSDIPREIMIHREDFEKRFKETFPSCGDDFDEADRDADPIIAALDRIVFFFEDLREAKLCTPMVGMSEEALMATTDEDPALESSEDHSATASETTTKTNNSFMLREVPKEYAMDDSHRMLVERILAERDHALDDDDDSSVIDMSGTTEATILEDLMKEGDQAKDKKKSVSIEMAPENKEEETQDTMQAMLRVKKCPTDEMMTLQAKGSLTPIPEADESCPETPKSEAKLPDLLDAAMNNGTIPSVPLLAESVKKEPELDDIPYVQSFSNAVDDFDEDPVLYSRQNGIKAPANENSDLIVDAFDSLFLCYDDIQDKRTCGGCMGSEPTTSFVETQEDANPTDEVVENLGGPEQSQEENQVGSKKHPDEPFEQSRYVAQSHSETTMLQELPGAVADDAVVDEAVEAPPVESTRDEPSNKIETTTPTLEIKRVLSSGLSGEKSVEKVTARREISKVLKTQKKKTIWSSNQLSGAVVRPMAKQGTEDSELNAQRSFQDALKDAKDIIAKATISEKQQRSEDALSWMKSKQIGYDAIPASVLAAEKAGAETKVVKVQATRDPVVDIIDQMLLAYDDKKEREELVYNLNEALAKARDCILENGAAPGGLPVWKPVSSIGKEAKFSQPKPKAQQKQQLKSQDRVVQVEVQFELPDEQEPCVSWGGDDSELMASINADRTLSQMEHKNIFRDISKGLEQSGSGIITRADNKDMFPLHSAPAFSESGGAAESFENPAAAALKVLCEESISYDGESASEAKKFQGWTLSKKRETILKTKAAEVVATEST